jgi:hypothetical protein
MNFENCAGVDTDFLLCHMNSDLDHIDEVIEEIPVIVTAKKTERISLQRRYPGVRTQIIGDIKKVRVPFDVDFGLGDIIVPKVQKSV